MNKNTNNEANTTGHTKHKIKAKGKVATAKDIFTSPVHFLAFGFGSGLAPKAPGTFGTLAAIPIYLLLMHTPLMAYLAVTLIVSIAGIWICGESAKKLGVHDFGGIVWDEIAGFLVTMILAPAGWLWIAIGFVFFRIFDILKPWPCSWLDKNIHGGLGIMIDDIVAGFYAFLVLQLIAWQGFGIGVFAG